MALDRPPLEVSNKMTASGVPGFDLNRNSLDQAESYSTDFYHLETPPEVFIFYSTKGRLSKNIDAEAEKVCVEKYFTERNFPCTAKKDPTSADIFMAISAAQGRSRLSGLVVFLLCHAGDSNVMAVQDIITLMCRCTKNKPKVSGLLLLCEIHHNQCACALENLCHIFQALILQACQIRNEQTNARGMQNSISFYVSISLQCLYIALVDVLLIIY